MYWKDNLNTFMRLPVRTTYFICYNKALNNPVFMILFIRLLSISNQPFIFVQARLFFLFLTTFRPTDQN